MNYKKLHTDYLEELFGPISLHILKQNESIRIVELKDKDKLCRTFAIVRFLNINGEKLKAAHEKIVKGELLGKTLCDFKIDFDREFIGSVQVKLPDWLKDHFKTTKDSGFGFVSHIWVNDDSTEPDRFVFSEIIEIIPPELKNEFIHNIKPLKNLDLEFLTMFEEAKIEML
jgi:hypothetical protein